MIAKNEHLKRRRRVYASFCEKNGKRIINDQRKFIFAIITKIPVKVQKNDFI